MTITAAPGAQFSWDLTFKNPKVGYAGVFTTVGGFHVQNPDGSPYDWNGYASQALTPVVQFNGATTATLTLTAPSQPGSYTVQNIVPADGGTVGSDTLVVAGAPASSPGGAPAAGAPPAAGGVPGTIAGLPTPVVLGAVGLGVLLLLMD